MTVFTYSQARRNLAAVLERAKKEGKVLIKRKDGSLFALYPETPSADVSYLYHYTTAEGLKGIAEENRIRATNIFYMNDSEELRGGLRLFENKLEELASTHEIYSQALREIRSWFLGEGQGLSLERTVQIYACCFSEKKDVLSQWRAYCPEGGFAVGFRRSKVEALVKGEDLALSRCLYRRDEQLARINAILDDIRAEALQSDEAVGSQPNVAQDSRYFEIIDAHMFEIIRTAATFKHIGFHEEAEWRVMTTLQRAERPGELKSRVRKGRLVPYREISLNGSMWEDAHIVVAPGAPRELVLEAARRLLWHSRPESGTATFEASDTPYRH